MRSATDDSRRSPRSRVLLSAVVEWPDKSVSVVLRDLSEDGALVETSEQIEAGSRIYFRRNELRVPGRIAWVKDRLAGIAFGRPLKSEVVLRHISRPLQRPVSPDVCRRPGFNRSEMRDEGSGK